MARLSALETTGFEISWSRFDSCFHSRSSSGRAEGAEEDWPHRRNGSAGLPDHRVPDPDRGVEQERREDRLHVGAAPDRPEVAQDQERQRGRHRRVHLQGHQRVRVRGSQDRAHCCR